MGEHSDSGSDQQWQQVQGEGVKKRQTQDGEGGEYYLRKAARAL